MPLEALILRRVFPVPVTFADLRRARCESPLIAPWEWELRCGKRSKNAIRKPGYLTREWWHAAIKEATGALDEVYAVIDGREVRVAIVRSPTDACVEALNQRERAAVESLLIAADEAGYWQRPHEVRVDLDESQMSHKTMARIAAASIAIAGSK
jgi:hypothetical protein